MSEVVEMPTDLRMRNYTWIKDTVIPNLYQKGFPLKKLLANDTL